DVFVVVRWERANSVTCNSKTAIIAGVAANRAFQPFTLVSSLAPRAGLVTWRQTFVHCSQQTAASNQSNELTLLQVEHRGLPPPMPISAPTGLFGLPHAQPASERRLEFISKLRAG